MRMPRSVVFADSLLRSLIDSFGNFLSIGTVIMTMPFKYKSSVTVLSIVAGLLFLSAGASAQTSNVPPRITEVVNESKLTVLHGNTHPLAQPQFDRGPAPSDLPMERMQAGPQAQSRAGSRSRQADGGTAGSVLAQLP